MTRCGTTRQLALTLALIAATAGCGQDPEAPPAAPSAAAFQNKKPIVQWELPAFTATDQRGVAVTNKDLEGKVTVVTFFFIRCSGPCPAMIQALSQVGRDAKDVEDLRLMAFTFKPEEDKVEDLERYARSWRLPPDRLRFLRTETGAEVRSLQENGFKAGGWDHHSANFFLIDQKGRVRRWWDARDDHERAALIHDIRTLAAGRKLDHVDQ
jgi:protein SCO1/2